ncbi:uncharacterized protein LOC123269968 [Cotesia glomerata]|uniref:Uncharacterized protein n=1 Tax=Cotesia glomerata TaxID=32391 RepID=A0AAV7IAV7_COTGL|nr:uncharacterized protein LOC123269968 [Cotesia glomerata]KAH0546498.1 hypothetical protein KQX54_010490 [Cotesia glomerata]
MANLKPVSIPSEFPMSAIYHNVTVYSKKNEPKESNDNEFGTGTLYVTTDLTVWIKNDEENGFEFYLSDISQISYENDAIFMLLSCKDGSYMIKMMLHVEPKTAYKILKYGIKLAKNSVVEEFPVLELPKGVSPTAENIKFDRKVLDYKSGSMFGVATIYFPEESFYLVYNKEGPKLSSGYEAKDITATILENKQIQMKTENSHFSVMITLMPANDEDFKSLCKKIKEAIKNPNEEDSPKDERSGNHLEKKTKYEF